MVNIVGPTYSNNNIVTETIVTKRDYDKHLLIEKRRRRGPWQGRKLKTQGRPFKKTI